MAVTLKPFQFHWKVLNTALNQIVDAINRNAPLEGENIHLDEKGQHGTSINAIKAESGQSSQQTGSGSGGTPVALMAFDTSGNPIILNVMTDGSAPTGADLQWFNVDVVTPPGCSPQTISVLTKPAS